MKIKRDWLGKRYTIIAEDRLDEEALQKLNKYIDNLEEENKKLKDELYIWKLTARDYARLQGVDLPELSNI